MSIQDIQFKKRILTVVIAICVLPAVLDWAGVHTVSPSSSFDAAAVQAGTEGDFLKEIDLSLSRRSLHAVLEWSVFWSCIFTLLLAVIHYHIKHDRAYLLLGLVLFGAGVADIFPTWMGSLAHQSEPAARNSAALTWTVFRFAHAALSIAGVAAALFWWDRLRATHGRSLAGMVLGLSVVFYISALIVIYVVGGGDSPSQFLFPDAMPTRPWDLAALPLLVLLGSGSYFYFFRRIPGFFAFGLLAGLVPECAVQLYMALGSSAPFDNHFMAAHFLRNLVYVLPLAGLCADYIRGHREQATRVERIQEAQLLLAERTSHVARATQELERAERALKLSLEQIVQAKREWETTADSLSELVCLLDKNANIIRVNRTVELWELGSVDEAQGKPILGVLHPDASHGGGSLESVWQDSWEALKSGESSEHEFEDPILSRYLRMHVRPVFARVAEDRAESSSYAVAVFQDITLRKRAEQAIAHAREQESEIAYKIQKMLLLGRPPEDMPGISVAAYSLPSQRIDGDFYDFYRPSPEQLDVVIGDVMGKGIAAGLLGAATKSHFLRAMSTLHAVGQHKQFPEPDAIVQWVHEAMTGELMFLETFETLCFSRFDLGRMRLDFVDCGHTKTIHFRPRMGIGCVLEGENLPLGVSEEEIYRQASAMLEPGDLFLFYSDGITEARNPQGEFFEMERLVACVHDNADLPPEALIEKTRATVVAFTGSEKFTDDLTCVVVRIEPEDCSGALTVSERIYRSDTEVLSGVRADVADFCTGRIEPPLPEEKLNELVLAVVEAVTNIIRHAYDGRPDESFSIALRAYKERLEVDLRYEGERFRPEGIEPPDLESMQEGGYGLFIINQCADNVEYLTDGTGAQRIRIVKNRRA